MWKTRDTGLIPGLRRSPGRGHEPTSVFSPGKFHGQRKPKDYNSCCLKASDTTEHMQAQCVT